MRDVRRTVAAGSLWAVACGFDGSGVNSSGNLDPSVGDSSTTDTGGGATTIETGGGVDVDEGEVDSKGEDSTTTTASPEGTTGISACDGWWNEAWTHRRALGIADIGLPDVVVDVPVLVVLDANRIDYGATMDAGEDLRFVVDGTDVLAHEIEVWNEAGTSFVWIRLPMLAPDGNGQVDLHVYYGNPAAEDGQQPQEVWDDGYVSVHHMRDFTDSTGNGHDGASPNPPTAVEGWIGGALRFDGVDDRLTLIGEAPYDFVDALTVEAWIRVQSFDLAWQAVVTKGDDAWRMHREDATNSIGFGTDTISTNDNLPGTTNVNDGEWHWAVVAYGDDLKRILVDGMQDVDQAYPGPVRTTDYPVVFGENAQTTGRFFDGDIDEVRISSVSRSRTWLRAQHRSMTDTLLVHGGHEQCP